MLIVQLPAKEGVTRTKKHVGLWTTAEKMLSGTPFAIEEDAEFFMVVPPKDVLEFFDVTIFYRKHYQSFQLMKFKTGCKIVVSL